MSAKPVLEARDLGKKFKLYANPWYRGLEWMSGGRRSLHQEIWALRQINFALEPGESLGIIGRNGSGKSTLLKILAGATQPTEGKFVVRGPLLALLELGAGFSGDLTGRQNVLVSSELLGFPAGYAAKRLTEIETFAELGDYFDRPVRTYSSGMFVRLAFSTFVFLSPKVLIVDEALSVGDVFFQQKCFGAIRDILDRGTSLIYVSHDMTSVSNLCDKVLLLDHGLPAFFGEPEEAVARYFALSNPVAHQIESNVDYEAAAVSEGSAISLAEQIIADSILTGANRLDRGGLEILAARVTDDTGRPSLEVTALEHLTLQILARARCSVAEPNIGLELYDRLNQLVFAISALNLGERLRPLRAGEHIVASFRVRFSLQPGQYTFVLVTADQAGTTDPNQGAYHDRHERLGPILVRWDAAFHRFYGITALDTTVHVVHDSA